MRRAARSVFCLSHTGDWLSARPSASARIVGETTSVPATTMKPANRSGTMRRRVLWLSIMVPTIPTKVPIQTPLVRVKKSVPEVKADREVAHPVNTS